MLQMSGYRRQHMRHSCIYIYIYGISLLWLRLFLSVYDSHSISCTPTYMSYIYVTFDSNVLSCRYYLIFLIFYALFVASARPVDTAVVSVKSPAMHFEVPYDFVQSLAASYWIVAPLDHDRFLSNPLHLTIHSLVYVDTQIGVVS